MGSDRRVPDQPPRTQELRVHGVGGSHGARMLGFDSVQDAVIVGEGIGGTAVLARREDPSVESYDWGDLTSGTGSKPFWVFLLPFTLINLAGWMHPPEGGAPPGVIRMCRGLVHVLSALLTATYVFTLGIILVDLMGYQWAGRLAVKDDQAVAATSVVTGQKWGVVAGLVVLLGLVAALVYTAGASQTAFEGQPLSSLQDMDRPNDEPWTEDERLDRQTFFFHPKAARARFRIHLAVAGACYLMVVALAVYRVFVHPGGELRDQLKVGELLSVCSGLAYVAVLLLWATSLAATRRDGERWTRSGPAIAATLAFGLVNAVVSGTILLLIKQLNKWPNRPAIARPLQGGPEVNLVDVWGGLAIGFGVAAAALLVVVIFFPRAGTDDVRPERRSGPGCQIDGLPTSMRKSVARARYFSILARRGGLIVFVIAFTIYVVGLLSVLKRAQWSHFPPGLPAPRQTGSLLYQVGAYVLPALALLLVQAVRKGRKGARTFASTLWDVFTFWPRRYSPLAVRPYSERAVPELQGRVLHHTKDKQEPCPLVLGVHSQGSILAFAALAPLSAEQLSRVALVTYGCPVSTIYSMFFPAYFGPAQVSALRDKLSSPGPELTGWRNFYRRTDPIGGPVFPLTTPEYDTEVPDPFPGPVTDIGDETPPLERDAAPWLRVSGHSHYMQEPVLKDWLRRVRTALDRKVGGP